MSHHPGFESDQKDPTKSMNEAPAAIGLKVGDVQTLVIKGDVIVQAGNKGDNKHEGTRNNFTAMKMACNGGNFTTTEHGATNTLAVQPPSGDTSAQEQSTTDSPTTAGSPAPKRRRLDTSETDDGIVKLSDDIFMNTKKRLRKGMSIYKGYQEYVGGSRLPRAIKAITPISKEDIKEVDCLVKLGMHTNVVQIIQSIVKDKILLYIVMELCSPLTLHDYLKEKRENNSPFDFKKAMSYSKGLIKGMKHIHDNRIIHGDLKPQNIVFSLKGDQIKVTDFGISKQLQESWSVTDMTGKGTDGYRAPETYISRCASLKADIFPLGIILYSIFTNGKHPFGEVKELWSHHIKENKGRDLSGLPEEIVDERDEFLNLLGNMLEFDPQNRPTMKEISDHAFFSDNQASTAQVPTKLKVTNYDQPSTSHHPNVMEQTSTAAVGSVISNQNEVCVNLSDLIWMFPNEKISTHGEIYHGELRSTNGARPVVLKLVDDKTSQGEKEARILAKLNHHSHVLSLIQSGTCSHHFAPHTYIALEKCHHENLREFVTNRKHQGFAFNLSRAIEIAGQMVDGVKHIHENKIIHKDIKPDNILFSLDLKLIKIADFGQSQEIDSTSAEVFEMNHFGTDGFRPPESFGKGTISQKSDIFSLGVTFYFVLSNGEHPFGEDKYSWNKDLKDGKTPNLSGLLVQNIKATQHLIKSMIEHKINDRSTIWQVSEHPFWTGNEDSCDFGRIQLSDSIWLFQNRRLAKKVFEGVEKNEPFPNRQLAIKCFWGFVPRNLREAENLRKLGLHTNVVAIVYTGVYRTMPGVDCLYIAMEKCNTLNLEHYIKDRISKNVPFNPNEAFEHAKQVIDAINHIHGHNIMHRDLKPSSVLFSLCGRYIKICDFGMSKELKYGHTVTVLSTLSVGTDGYRAPETYNKDVISKMADIFSLALVLYHLLSYGFHPFGIDPDIRKYNITKGQGLDLSRLRDPFLKIVKELLEKMLNFKPKDRLTIDQVKNSECMKLDLFSSLIESLVPIWNGAIKDHVGADVLSCKLYRSPSLQDVVEIYGSGWKFQMNIVPCLNIGSLKKVIDEEPSGYIVTSKDELRYLTNKLTSNNSMGWIDISKDEEESKVIVLLFQPGYPELFGFFFPDTKILTSLLRNLALKRRSTLQNLTPGFEGRTAFQSATNEREQLAPGLIPWWIYTGDLQK